MLHARARVVRHLRPAGFGCELTVSRSAQLGAARNALQFHGGAWGSVFIEDLNLFDAALYHAFRNIESFVSIAREHTE